MLKKWITKWPFRAVFCLHKMSFCGLVPEYVLWSGTNREQVPQKEFFSDRYWLRRGRMLLSVCDLFFILLCISLFFHTNVILPYEHSYSFTYGEWLEHQTCNRKVAGLSPSRSSGRTLFQGQLSVLTLTAVWIPRLSSLSSTLKEPSYSAKSSGCRLQLSTLCMWLGMKWH